MGCMGTEVRVAWQCDVQERGVAARATPLAASLALAPRIDTDAVRGRFALPEFDPGWQGTAEPSPIEEYLPGPAAGIGRLLAAWAGAVLATAWPAWGGRGGAGVGSGRAGRGPRVAPRASWLTILPRQGSAATCPLAPGARESQAG